MFDEDSTAAEPQYTAKCPYCMAQLQIEQDRDNPKPDDPVSCYFHGVIGTRLSVLVAIKNHDLEMIVEDPVNETRPKAIHSVQLTYDQIKALVRANNKSGLSDSLIIAIAWKESSFIPGSQNSKSTAGGLLQVEHGAVRELRRLEQHPIKWNHLIG